MRLEQILEVKFDNTLSKTSAEDIVDSMYNYDFPMTAGLLTQDDAKVVRKYDKTSKHVAKGAKKQLKKIKSEIKNMGLHNASQLPTRISQLDDYLNCAGVWCAYVGDSFYDFNALVTNKKAELTKLNFPEVCVEETPVREYTRGELLDVAIYIHYYYHPESKSFVGLEEYTSRSSDLRKLSRRSLKVAKYHRKLDRKGELAPGYPYRYTREAGLRASERDMAQDKAIYRKIRNNYATYWTSAISMIVSIGVLTDTLVKSEFVQLLPGMLAQFALVAPIGIFGVFRAVDREYELKKNLSKYN